MIEDGAVQVINGFLYVIAAVIVLAVPVMVTRIAVYVKARWAEIARSQPEFIRVMVENAAKFAIAYVEQVMESAEAKEKLAKAIEIAKNFLASSGFHGIDTSTLEHAIEALLTPTKLEIKQQKAEIKMLKSGQIPETSSLVVTQINEN